MCWSEAGVRVALQPIHSLAVLDWCSGASHLIELVQHLRGDVGGALGLLGLSLSVSALGLVLVVVSTFDEVGEGSKEGG